MTTPSKQAEEAGRIILRCWTNGEAIERLPDRCRPRTMADGYAAQRALAAASGEAVAGWKIAATSVEWTAPHQRRRPHRGTAAREPRAPRPGRGDVGGKPHGGRGGGVRVRDGQRSSRARGCLRRRGSTRGRRHAAPGHRASRFPLRGLHPRRQRPARRGQRLRARIRPRARHRRRLACDRPRRAAGQAFHRRPRGDDRRRRRRPRQPPESRLHGSRTTTQRRARRCKRATSSPPESAASRAPSPREAMSRRTWGRSAPPR